MMNEWLTLVLELGARVLAVLGLALLLTTLMRRASASARHFVWTLAGAAVLLLPAFTLFAPRWRVLPVPAPARVTVTAPAPQATPAPRAAAAPEATPALPVRPAPAPLPAPAAEPAVLPAAPRGFDRSGFVPLALFALWLAGAGALLLRLAVGMARMRRIAAGAERVWSGPLHDALQGVARDLGIARPVRLFARADAMPITWGFIYPAVLLPEVAARWSPARLDTVLRHELAHVARADAFTQLIADVARALHWYNPLAWHMCARLRVEREYACDDLVLTHGRTRPSEYAEELLSLARAYRVQNAGAHAAMAMARPATLRARLAAVLDGDRSRARVGRGTAWSAIAAAVLLLLPVAGLAPARAIPVDERVSEAPERPLRTPAAAARVEARPAPAIAPVASAGLSLAAQAVSCLSRRNEKVDHISSNANRDSYRLTYRSASCEGEVRIEGKLTFNADFTRLAGISRGGSVRMEEEFGREKRRLEIEPSGSGLAYRWLVNGKEQKYDAAAQAWQADMLLVLFRRLGYMAEERALAILERRGADAVLVEVGLMDGDHAQSTYLTVLLKQGRLSPAAVQRVLALAGKVLESDHYLASTLASVARTYPFDEATRGAFLAAARTLESDHYRHQVLTAALDGGGLTPAQVAMVVEQAGTLDSDHYRGTLLASVAAKYALSAPVRAAYLRAVRTMDSDHYRSEALLRLLAGGRLPGDQVAEVIDAAGTLDSDHSLAQVLNRVEPAALASPALQQAFLRAASGLESDYYLAQVLTRIVNAGNLDEARLRFVLAAAANLESDNHLADVLTRIANRYPLTGATRQQFMEVLGKVESSYFHGQVSSALLRKG